MSTSAQHFADPGQVHERRLHPRIFPKTLVYVACGATNGGMVLNASDDGLAISMAIAVGGDSFSNMLVRMNGLPQALEASGRIVWTNVSRKRAGIQLLNVNDALRAEISEWLAYEGVREVHLVPQEAKKIAAPVAPVFDESRYSLLQAFGGSTPESLGPVPALVDQVADHRQSYSPDAIAETQPPQEDFPSLPQDAFRDNEWDLADVTLIPRKKSTRAGLPAYVLIFLWIAIPCFGIGMLVGRRPLEQWLARGDANGENISPPVKGNSQPVGGTRSALDATVEASSARPSAQDAALSRVHVDATNYPVSHSTVASPLPQNTSVELLNSLSTQEVRAIKKPSITVAAPPSQPPAIPYPESTKSKAPSVSSLQPTKPTAALAPAAPAPAVIAAPVRKTDSSTIAVARDVQPPTRSSNSPTRQNYDEPMPKTLSVDSGLPARSTAKISTPGNVPPAPMSAVPASPMMARSPSATSTPPSSARSSFSSASPNPAPARPVSPGASPSIAPVLPQPPLHGVMRVARKNDESFVLRLPLESVSGDHNTSIRMQRFVMVPKESRWHGHGPIVKLTVGELLTHGAPDSPRAMNAGAIDVITVRASVDKNGAVEALKPVSGRFALLPRVMRAVREWQFDRTLLDGKPVESEVNVTMEFRPAR